MAKFPSPSPTQKSRSWVLMLSVQIGHQLSSSILLLLLFHLSIANSSPSYAEHCSSIIPETKSYGSPDPSRAFQLRYGTLSGGEKIIGRRTGSPHAARSSFQFRTTNIHKTESDGVFKIEGSLTLRRINDPSVVVKPSFFERLTSTQPASLHRRGTVKFQLTGFWSVSIGKLCMVGSGFDYSDKGNPLHLSSVLKLNYGENATIVTSFATGTLESIDTVDNLNYFDSISLLGFSSPEKYEYTLIDRPENSCFESSNVYNKENSLKLGSDENICSVLHDWFELEYMSNCTDKCNPLDKSVGSLPTVFFFGGLQCLKMGRVHFYLGFYNSSFYGYYNQILPDQTLVGEGKWDGAKNQLCLTACRLTNFTNSLVDTSVEDCSIGLILTFPAVLSIRNRSSVVGHIWSRKKMNESGYFDKIMFRGFSSATGGLPGLVYRYTIVDTVNESCLKAAKSSGKRYPTGYSNGEMGIGLSAEGSKSKDLWGSAYPLSIGDSLYGNSITFMEIGEPKESMIQAPVSNHNILNVSYTISFSGRNDFKWGVFSSTKRSPRSTINFFAEGKYDAETGNLCMVGCRYLNSSFKKSTENMDSMDCQIHIDIQLPPLNPEGKKDHKGTIRSMRDKSDPIYFEPLELTSSKMYWSQAEESIWRMNLEIAMVLISLTLACVFIRLQLVHVKRHPDAVPSISLTLLVVLTLGHMIPLVLNFEALFFTDLNQQHVLISSGGWLQVKEILVRVLTMVAFLLQFRILQLTWSARSAGGSKMGFWVAEKKTLCLCLPLYFLGGFVALIFHSKKSESVLPPWEDLRSYAGLVLDSFLLPQVVLNLFLNSNAKALAPSFYVGTTVVRSLPHAYDAYRSHEYMPYFYGSYIYANPSWEFYSTAWNVIIPCGGLLLVILIYLQQRFGGRCILPPRFRECIKYEKLPVASG